MAKLSPLLREKLKRDPPQLISCVVEVRRDRLEYVLSELGAMELEPMRELISQPVPEGNFYIPVAIPAERIVEVSEIEGVVIVHKSLPVAIGGLTAADVPFFQTIVDELIGELRIPAVEIPYQAMSEVLPNPMSALKALGSLAVPFTGFNPLTNVRIFPTSVTASIIKDVTTRDGAGVTVAVIDTGSPMICPQWVGKWGVLEEYTVVPEHPTDTQGHGSWCMNCVCGSSIPSRYGTITGMAPAVEKSIHVKALNTFPGMGMTEGILKAIEIAVKRGSKVISMSLGGPAQGDSIEGDIQCKIINELTDRGIFFAIASGNSGSNLFTIGSPGVALKCISCASASMIDNFNPAYWSSRGGGSKWDGDHQEEWKTLLARYGDELIKPDVSCLGGGRAEKGAAPDEIIWSGASGWFTSFYDGIPGFECGMKGTSMSTPHVAGLIACLLSDGVVEKVDDVKRALRETAPDYIVPDPINEIDSEYIERYGKSIATGWGLFKLSRFK